MLFWKAAVEKGTENCRNPSYSSLAPDVSPMLNSYRRIAISPFNPGSSFLIDPQSLFLRANRPVRR